MPPKRKPLFDNDSDDDGGLQINKNYAEHYQKFRSKELYETLKARNQLEDSDSSEEEDKNYDTAFNPEFDKEFLLSLGTLYSQKDLKEAQFFEGDYRVEKKKEDKPMNIKDYESRRLMSGQGEFEDSGQVDYNSGSFAPEPSNVRFDDGLDDSDDGDGDDGLLGSGLFKRIEDGSSKKVQQNSALDYVKGKTSAPPDVDKQDVLKNLKDAWNSEDLSKKDKWLVNFFLKEKYLAGESGEESNNSFSSDEEILEEEENDKKLNPLAPKYKFRHQEPGQFIKRVPRNIDQVVRSKDEKRKQARNAAKLRLQKKKEEKKEEIEVLKALKLKEIKDKIARIKEASGNEDIDLGAVDLDEDFDPATHDAQMEQVLGESYYDDCNAEDNLPAFEEEEDDTEIYDKWSKKSDANGNDGNFEDPEEEGSEHEEERKEEDDLAEDIEHNGEDFNMDADYDPSTAQKTNKKSVGRTRRKGKKSKLKTILEKEKPLFDPNEKDYASYYDEYYQLDFEDVVAGIPCRFKYRNVEPNNFGLTTDEILSADNAELNKWAGIKKLLQYNRTKDIESLDRLQYTSRASHDHVKKKIFPSLYIEDPEELLDKMREKRRLKNLKRKENKRKALQALVNGKEENVKESDFDSKSEHTDKNTNKTGLATPEEEQNNEEQMGEASAVKSEQKKKKNKGACKKKNQDTPVQEASPERSPKKKHVPIEKSVEESPMESKPEKKKKRKAESTKGCPAEDKAKKIKKREEVPEESKNKMKKKTRISKDKDVARLMSSREMKALKSRDRFLALVKYRKQKKLEPYLGGVSDTRLAAYGEHPKTIKNRILYKDA